LKDGAVLTSLYLSLCCLLDQEEGQTIPEYALLLALLALAVIASVLLLGSQISAVLVRLADALTGV
jgi:Flp pilus assembly pilin Flp